jgi:Oxidoreductase family, NAD-binding Rossmann fold
MEFLRLGAVEGLATKELIALRVARALIDNPAMRACLWIFLNLIVSGGLLGGEIRIGLIGCDTSHATAFTETLNNPQAKGHVSGGRVVAAFKGGSPDIPESWSRVEPYAKTLREKYGVTFYDTIGEMVRHVDAILLESVDGRPHLDQFTEILAEKRRSRAEHGAALLIEHRCLGARRFPVFIDKPVAGTLADAQEIFRRARRANVPVFSSSALRFGSNTQAVAHGVVGEVSYVETYGPCELEPHHPDLFWYGVHGTEALFTMLGCGCETVQRGKTVEGKIEVVGTWRGGRKGVFREDKTFHGVAKGSKGEAPAGSFDGYVPLVGMIMEFFKSRVPPIRAEETIEIFAFMAAADASKANGGSAVRIEGVLRPNRP